MNINNYEFSFFFTFTLSWRSAGILCYIYIFLLSWKHHMTYNSRNNITWLHQSCFVKMSKKKFIMRNLSSLWPQDSSKCILIKKKHVHHAFKSLYASHFYVFFIKIINKNEHCDPCITDSNEIFLKICYLTREKQWNKLKFSSLSRQK